MELEIEKKLDEERKTITEEAKKEADEENRLKNAEKDKQMEQLRNALADAKRKSEQITIHLPRLTLNSLLD